MNASHKTLSGSAGEGTMTARKSLAVAALALAIATGASPLMAQTANTTTTYTYDAQDRLTGVTDPSGLNTTYSYDGLSDPTGQVSPDTGTTARTFDAAGNVLTATDAKSNTVTYTYDAGNRRLSASYADATQNITYAYDEPNSTTGCSTSYPIGRLTRIIENAVTTVYCYDARGNVIQKQQITSAGTDTTGYAVTAAGRLSGIVYPSSTMVSYSRDADGRIQSISVTPPTGSASTAVSNVTYQPFGPVSGYTLGNGQQIVRTYDANYRLTDLISPAFNLHVARDAMGDITAIGNAPGANPATETYSYDPLYRLTAVTEANGTTLESVTYNQTGDRLTKSGSGLATGTYSYNPNTHQLIATGNAARSVDADGNTTAISAAGSTYGFGYNDRNRMTVAQLGGSTVGSYTYNAFNERIQKVANSATERYDYNEGMQLLGEYGATNRDYIWMDGIPVANVDTSGAASTLAYVTADQLGTPRAIADGSGNTEWQNAYQGNPWNEQAPTSNGYVYNLGFPGQYFDQETGLSNNVNRDYDPSTGRYIQSDPIGLLGGPNTYGYGLNDPSLYIDPLGLATAVLVGGPAPGNPFGHVALAFTNQGVYSYQTYTPYGSSTTAYLAQQGETRGTTVYILNTTPEQEQQMMDYFKNNYTSRDNYSKWTHDCATAVNGALATAGIGNDIAEGVAEAGGIWLPNLPLTSQFTASSFPGASIIQIPQGSSVPASLSSFNPGGH